MSDDIDFGTAFYKKGNPVKVTVNTFRGVTYLHIREYFMDGDTGEFFPTNKGFAFDANEVSSLIPLLEQAETEVAKAFLVDKKKLGLDEDE